MLEGPAYSYDVLSILGVGIVELLKYLGLLPTGDVPTMR